MHWLQVCIPNRLLPDAEHAFVLINGGATPSNANSPPSGIPRFVSQLCVGARTISATLHQVPNQPIRFTADPTRARSEQALVAYTWSHYINDTLEPDWLSQLPMTKASIRALDTIQDFVQSLGTIKVPTKFVVGGYSKRGTSVTLDECRQSPVDLMDVRGYDR